jgi:hypothetical protein
VLIDAVCAYARPGSHMYHGKSALPSHSDV